MRRRSPAVKPRHWRSAPSVALVVLSGLALGACTQASPTLLRDSDFDGVVSATHNDVGQQSIPGPTWCEGLSIGDLGLPTGAVSELSFDEEDGYPRVGAVLVDQEMDLTAARLEDAAATCAAATEEHPELSIDPIDGLPDEGMGWRTGDDEGGLWGEYAAVPVGDAVLLVGFETDQEQAPVELDELIRLAREGVDRVGVDD